MKITFDSGIKEYEVNGGILRFNPSDPNVYGRFLDAMEKIQGVEDDLVAGGKQVQEGDGAAVVRLMVDADRRVKSILQEVFGRSNDFDAIFDGVNIMAVAGNGERVITNFMVAIEPIVAEGAEKCAQMKVDAAVAEAERQRALRRK